MPEAPSKPFRLWSIRFSHYNEKVRWTLDYLGVPYRETPLMPIVHWGVTPFVIGLFGHHDNHSTRFSTPILKTDVGRTLIKSSQIMRALSDRFSPTNEHLFPNAEVAELDEHYNRFLGPHTRRLFYFNVLNKPEVILDLARKNVPAKQAKVFEVAYGLCRNRILRGLGITSAQVEKGISYIYKEFEEVDKKLRDDRPFLTGERFTAADISFACLGGAIVLPQPAEGYGGQLPDYNCGCEQLVKISKELRSTAVGQWVLRLFREKRGTRLIPCEPLLPSRKP